jgi:hypothetical protein
MFLLIFKPAKEEATQRGTFVEVKMFANTVV